MTVGDWILWSGYFIAFLAIITGWVWTTTLYIAGSAYLRSWKGRAVSTESEYLWIFLVPALNEDVTIADSVGRLLGVAASQRVILVINDGSDDDTASVLDALDHAGLFVLTRQLPNARKGKSAAINHAFLFVEEQVLAQKEYRDFDRDKILIAIVDADGRLSPDAPGWVSRHFEDPRVGGVQVSVSIYNQGSWLTRMQQAEFDVFGSLLQLGRSRWGTAFMGGNGQFNRFTALKSIAGPNGPWADYLTEDQELGMRLLCTGWRSEFECETQVAQQGLHSMRRLYRQRTRWMQGNLQVALEVPKLYAYDLIGKRRFDVLFTLILPILQIVVGLALISAFVLYLGFGVAFLPLDAPILLAYTIILTIGPLGLGVFSTGRGGGFQGFVHAVRLFPSYYVYTFVVWPVVFIGLYKQLSGNRRWAKTERESIVSKSQPQR